ncbi:MAG: hypothetical protein LBV17_09800 [Treponema sp.]|jgi:hypothetical protein|nr:hypothetical protein [Treponema sp.]
MPEKIQTQEPVGYFDKIIPIWQKEGISREKAAMVGNEINSAYIYLINQNSNSYSKIVNKLQEIHIVTEVENKEYKYDLNNIGNKVILKFKQDVTYTEAIYCIINVLAKLDLNKNCEPVLKIV